MQALIIPIALMSATLVGCGLGSESKKKKAALVAAGLMLFVIGGEAIALL